MRDKDSGRLTGDAGNDLLYSVDAVVVAVAVRFLFGFWSRGHCVVAEMVDVEPIHPSGAKKQMSIPFPTLQEDAEATDATFTAFPAMEPKRPLRSKKRPTAFYGSPNPRAPPQPFSRSAAKRESVMALGSIQHLQHLYAKNGLASKARWV